MAVTAALAWLAGNPGPAYAATGAQTLHILFTGNPRAGVPGKVVATGLVKGIGTDRTVASEFDAAGIETDTDVISLRQGTITIRDTDAVQTFDLDPHSCVAKFRASGPYTVVAGTGAYAGASGGGTFTGRGLAVFDHTAAGCSEEPRRFLAVVTATGTLSFPGS